MGALRAFGLRIFVGYFLVLGASAYVALGYFGDAVKPAVRQTMEEMLVEEAHLVASAIEREATPKQLVSPGFRETWSALDARRVDANIYDVRKTKTSQRVYVVDDTGTVVFDSAHRDEGADYSKWNDVKRTLRGEYGARSTHEPEKGPSVLYVAAPIRNAGQIVGSVTVGKAASQMDPFVELARVRLLRSGAIVFVASLALGLVIALVLSRSVSRLVDYTKRVAKGERITLPNVGGELRELATAVDTMRTSLEGKQYVEKTIQTMAHELKSPLTAVVGAAELLEGPVADVDRETFARQIGSEARRMQAIVERLLELAVLEQRRGIQNPEAVSLGDVANRIFDSRRSALDARALTIRIDGAATVTGERLLLEQAFSNLIDNAIEFATRGSVIRVDFRSANDSVVITVANDGPAIPEFARTRVFERFYSLPRPDTNKRSTGLGLPFVRQVAELHGGTIDLENGEKSEIPVVTARLVLRSS